ncbi:MAG TPA: alpha/beta hydrolase [Acetobacteraceae bacterium]|jgi:pimeloyl-ACP methyl ester carboxylesterase
MLLPLDGRKLAYDLFGSENAPVVCMTHSLASDGGMWAEQARYEEIANARHFPNVEHPETFNRIMLSWLAAQRK